MPDIRTLCVQFKPMFLDSKGVSVRQFSKLVNIRRARLEKIFSGKADASFEELEALTRGMDVINARAAQQKK